VSPAYLKPELSYRFRRLLARDAIVGPMLWGHALRLLYRGIFGRAFKSVLESRVKKPQDATTTLPQHIDNVFTALNELELCEQLEAAAIQPAPWTAPFELDRERAAQAAWRHMYMAVATTIRSSYIAVRESLLDKIEAQPTSEGLGYIRSSAANMEERCRALSSTAKARGPTAAADVYYGTPTPGMPLRRGMAGPQGARPATRTFCFACHGEGHRVNDCTNQAARAPYDNMLKTTRQDARLLADFCRACHGEGHRWQQCPKESVRETYRARLDVERPLHPRARNRGMRRPQQPRAYLAEVAPLTEEDLAYAEEVEAYWADVACAEEEDQSHDNGEETDHASWDPEADAASRYASGNE
jgi:hypothetical protein